MADPKIKPEPPLFVPPTKQDVVAPATDPIESWLGTLPAKIASVAHGDSSKHRHEAAKAILAELESLRPSKP